MIMEIGDRVKVARMSEYDIMVCRSLKIPLHIGRTGVVVERAFSRSHGDVATVLMDDTNDRCIWCEKDLDVISVPKG